MDKCEVIREFYMKSVILPHDVEHYDELRKTTFNELVSNGCINLKKCKKIIGSTVRESYHSDSEVYEVCQAEIREKYKDLF